MKWAALQYERVWDDYHDGRDLDTQQTLDRRLDFLLDKGNLCGPPITKHLDDGIFELRAKDARMLFYFDSNRTVVFVHGITKKRGDVPRADIDLAKTRRKIIEAGKVKPNAFIH